jgi:hypothetical protein
MWFLVTCAFVGAFLTFRWVRAAVGLVLLAGIALWIGILNS